MKELSEMIGILEGKLVVMFDKDKTGHDFDHLQRTMRNALAIQKLEGGNLKVIAISALLHDMHRIMTHCQRNFVSPKDSLLKIREMLFDLDLTETEKDHICHAIEHHEEYSFSGGNVTVTDIESLILQDADNLDATGAIGLTRTIAFSLSHGIPVYISEIPLEQYEFTEGDKLDPSVIHHCVNKLVRLEKTMNTKTGKKLCKARCDFIRTFIKQFKQEWESTYIL